MKLGLTVQNLVSYVLWTTQLQAYVYGQYLAQTSYHCQGAVAQGSYREKVGLSVERASSNF